MSALQAPVYATNYLPHVHDDRPGTLYWEITLLWLIEYDNDLLPAAGNLEGLWYEVVKSKAP